MNNKTFYIFILSTALFLSCERDVTFYFEHNPKLVLNCILNPDSIVKASLTLSESLDSIAKFEPVENGVITLYEGNDIFGVLEPTAGGHYKLNKKPETEKTYKIVAEANGITTIQAFTTIPDKPEVVYKKEFSRYYEYDSLELFNYLIKIIDKPGPDNYWLYTTGRRSGGGNRAINAPFVDDFNRTIDAETKYGFRHFLAIRISDEGYDGEVLEFVIPDVAANTQSKYGYQNFLNADKHYDKHIKTTIINRMKETSELPFFEPVQMYSNIENGYGIFGSCAITTYNF